MSVAVPAVIGVALAAVVIAAVTRARRRKHRPASMPVDGEPLDGSDDATLDIGPAPHDVDAHRSPVGPDSEHGFFVHEESEVEPDGTYLHTRVLRIADGPGVPSLSLELIAPTLRRGELLRGDVVIDSATAHGGVLTLQAREVSGRLVVRVHTTHPAERVRAYWSRGI